ncbi:glycosyltransferase family 4 protein [candidate division KSB1 bacterium]|nr:glycosyltransferase family 4 protein [candidate division KSB1 bacterium]
MGVRICHITTVHPSFDVRIFHKECLSLARNGYEVYLIAGCEREETVHGVHLVPINKSRIIVFARLIHGCRAFRKAAEVDARIYHFHDPELLWVGALIKLLLHKRVIYDVHEDIQKHALGKAWIHPILRRLIATGLNTLEKLSEPFFDNIILAEDSYADKFGSKKIVIRNYPILSNDDTSEPTVHNPTFIYVGAIREIRGIFQMLEILQNLKADIPTIQLRLIGPFYPATLEEKVRSYIQKHQLEPHIQILGQISHTEIFSHIQESDIGLALLHPDANYVGSLPTKMFEYMMMSKPVVVSDFPMWKRIVHETGSGVVVDPLDVVHTTEIIQHLLQDDKKRKEMGERGRAAVRETYNWKLEERKLLACYKSLTSNT